MELKVEIFKFHLSKQAKDELETLREEMRKVEKGWEREREREREREKGRKDNPIF